MALSGNQKGGTARPVLTLPVVVEGRYDKSALLGIFEGNVLVTDGFGIFNSKEKQALIRRVAKDGIIVLTDSDGGGRQIRAFLSGIIPKEKIINLYIPEIPGKERRKTRASKAGMLGVEGVGREVLLSVFDKFIRRNHVSQGKRLTLTPADIYALGLSGGEDSLKKRDELCCRIGLPTGMRAKAFLTAVNMIFTEEEWEMELFLAGIGKDS